MNLLVKINTFGRRIGESHPRAVLTDHEVALLLELIDEREAVIGDLVFKGVRQTDIDAALVDQGLSYRCLALKFGIHKQTVAKIAKGMRRCQTPAIVQAVPLMLVERAKVAAKATAAEGR